MKKKELIQKVRDVHKEYCRREFGDDYEVKGNTLGVMYTSINDEEWEVQVSFDLKHQKEIVEIWNGVVRLIYEVDCSLEDMLEMLQEDNWTFDDFYSYAHDVCDERFSLDLEW